MDPILLAKFPLFQNLEPSDIELLAERFERQAYPADTVIFAQSDPADKLYILLEGCVAIRFKPEDGEILTVTEIGSNGVFGWSAALGRHAYTSCAVCVQDSVALHIEGDVLRELCETHPRTGVIILERLAEVIAERLRNTHAQVIEMLRQGLHPVGER
jgi:toluene monooxygenase system ferredoxin subunit